MRFRTLKTFVLHFKNIEQKNTYKDEAVLGAVHQLAINFHPVPLYVGPSL